MFNLFKSVESFLENVDQQASVLSTPDSKHDAGVKAVRAPEMGRQVVVPVVAPEPIRPIQSPPSYEPKSVFKTMDMQDTGFGADWDQKKPTEMDDWNNDDFADSTDWTHTPSKLNASIGTGPSRSSPTTHAFVDRSPKEAKEDNTGFWAQDDDWRTSSAPKQAAATPKRMATPEIRTASPSMAIKLEPVRASPIVATASFNDWDVDVSEPQDSIHTQVDTIPTQTVPNLAQNHPELNLAPITDSKPFLAEQEWDFDSPVVFQPTESENPLMGNDSDDLDFNDEFSSPMALAPEYPLPIAPNSPQKELPKIGSDAELVFDHDSSIVPVKSDSQLPTTSLWDDQGDNELFGASQWDSAVPETKETTLPEIPTSVPSMPTLEFDPPTSELDPEAPMGESEESAANSPLEPGIEEFPPYTEPELSSEPNLLPIDFTDPKDLHEMVTAEETLVEDETLLNPVSTDLSTSSPVSLVASTSNVALSASNTSLPSLTHSPSTPIEEGKEALRRLSLVQSKLKEQSKQIEQLTDDKLALAEQAKQREADLKVQLQKSVQRVSALELQLSSASQKRQQHDTISTEAHQSEIESLKEEHRVNQEAVVSHLTSQVNRYAKMNDELQSRYEEKKTQLLAMLDEKKRHVVSLESQIADLKADHQRSDQDYKKRDGEERRKVEEKLVQDRKEAEEAAQKRENTLTTRLDAALASIAQRDTQIQALETENGILAGEVALRKTGEAEEAKRAWELKETLEHSLEHSSAQLHAQILDLQAQRDLAAQEHATLQTQLAKAHAKSERAIAALQSQLDECRDLYTHLDAEYAEYKARAATHLKQLENQLELEKRQANPSLAAHGDESISNLHASHPSLPILQRDAIKAPAEKLLDLVNSGALASLTPSSSQSLKELVSNILFSGEEDNTGAEAAQFSVVTLPSLLALVAGLLSDSQSQASRLLLELEEVRSEKSSLHSSLPTLVNPLQIQVDRLHEDLNMREEKNEQLERLIEALQKEVQGHLDSQAVRDQRLKDLEKSSEMKWTAKDEEVNKLKRQLAARMAASTAQSELETRVKYLSDQLIAKQSIIDALESEKVSFEEWQSGVPGTASKPKRNEKRVTASPSSSMDGNASIISFQGDGVDSEGDIESQADHSTMLATSGSLMNSSSPFEASSFSEARSRIISRAKSVGRNVSSKLNANPIARKIASFFPRSVPAQVILFSYLAFLQLLVFYLMSSSSSSAATATDPLLKEKQE